MAAGLASSSWSRPVPPQGHLGKPDRSPAPAGTAPPPEPQPTPPSPQLPDQPDVEGTAPSKRGPRSPKPVDRRSRRSNRAARSDSAARALLFAGSAGNTFAGSRERVSSSRSAGGMRKNGSGEYVGSAARLAPTPRDRGRRDGADLLPQRFRNMITPLGRRQGRERGRRSGAARTAPRSAGRPVPSYGPAGSPAPLPHLLKVHVGRLVLVVEADASVLCLDGHRQSRHHGPTKTRYGPCRPVEGNCSRFGI